MKLLIITQKVDRLDPVLGFFHGWIRELSRHYEKISVICLEKGEYNLPNNVVVYSLGKPETGWPVAFLGRILSKSCALYTFYRLIIGKTDDYDAVFVHMNAEYVVWAGPWWRFKGKKIGLWYNHTVGSWALKIAAWVADILMYTSPFAYTSRYRQAVQMPAGINTDIFQPEPSVSKKDPLVYFQGRISKAKRVDILLDAYDHLRALVPTARLELAGPVDHKYVAPLLTKYSNYIADGGIVFLGPQSYENTPELFRRALVTVNLTADGNYDKTVLESLACGVPVIVSSRAFVDAPVIKIEAAEAGVLASALATILERESCINSEKCVQYVRNRHSLETLAEKIYNIMHR